VVIEPSNPDSIWVWCSGIHNNTLVFSPGQYTGNCTISFAISDGPDYTNGKIIVNMANNKPVTTQKFFSQHWSVVASGVTLPYIDAEILMRIWINFEVIATLQVNVLVIQDLLDNSVKYIDVPWKKLQ
jgi:hypothetical protein